LRPRTTLCKALFYSHGSSERPRRACSEGGSDPGTQVIFLIPNWIFFSTWGRLCRWGPRLFIPPCAKRLFFFGFEFSD
jgi:hypothetical protein